MKKTLGNTAFPRVLSYFLTAESLQQTSEILSVSDKLVTH